MNSRILIPLFCLGLGTVACEKRTNENVSPSGEYEKQSASPVTQPEGSSGSTRSALPAGGAAETGQGVTNSNTSAASGAVQMPSDPQSTGPTANQADQGTTGTPNNPGSQGSPTNQNP